MRLTVAFAASLLPLPLLADLDEARLIAIAKDAVIAEVKGQKQDPIKNGLTPEPVFVTIELNGKVVGCRGSLAPRSRSLEEEIRLAARSAAAHDPRYRPLTPADLERFQVTVTIVKGTDAISDIDGLRPEDGLILKAGTRTGIVLPWEGKDPKVRLQWAYRKAGVPLGTSCQLQRLKAIRFKG